MKRFTVALAGLVLVGGLALVVSTVSSGVGAYGPVYTVSALRARLADKPHAWLGHIVLVRGVALGFPCPPTASCPLLVRGVALGPPCPPTASCAVAWRDLIEANAAGQRSYLPLSMGPANPLLAQLRRLPLVGRLVPGPQLLEWGRPAIYRVQIQDAAGTSPNGTRHDEAVLLDPAPPGHGPLPVWQGPAWPVMPLQPVPRGRMPVAKPLPPVTMPHAIP